MTRLRDDESGFTLIETIVASMLGVLVLGIGASLLLSLFRTQHNVSDYADATTTGQLISRSVEEGVRNSGAAGTSGILSGAAVDGQGQLLRARVADGTSAGDVTWACEAWYYSSSTGSVLFARSSSSAIADPGGFVWKDATHTGVAPVAAQPGVTWTLLGTGIAVPPDSSVQQIFGAAADSSGAPQVTLGFEVTHGSVNLVLIRNTIVQRKLDPTGTGPATCF